MKFQKLNEYLERAEKLLNCDDEVNLTYCALELRRAIELIIWTQFKDAFYLKLSEAGMYHFDYPFKLQKHSISKMYELLKKHIKEYALMGSNRRVITHFSASGNAPYKKDGDVCFIPPELPTSDYDYLSLIIHYEKELDSKKYFPDKIHLKDIFNRLKFVKKNYTYRFMTVNNDIDNIIPNIKKSFKLTDKNFKSFL